jgi:hypothetical protein
MKLLSILVALAFVATPFAVSAQEGGQVKTKFYNFDDLLIDGQYKKPQVLYTDARQKVKFERLLNLKKDFLPKLKATAKDASLR